MPLKFAANLSTLFTEWPFEDRFAAAADAGFDYVECQFPYEIRAGQLSNLLDSSGVKLVLFNAPPGDWEAGERGLAALPDRRDTFMSGLDQAAEYAEAGSVDRIHVMAGLADSQDAEAQNAYQAAITLACERLGPRRKILIEPINQRNAPGYFLSDFDRARTWIEKIAAPNLALQFDIYHRQIIHGDVLKGLESFMPLIGHVQTASVPDRHEPGTGELHDGRVFEEIARLGYAGFIGCEYHPAGATHEGLVWRDEFSVMG